MRNENPRLVLLRSVRSERFRFLVVRTEPERFLPRNEPVHAEQFQRLAECYHAVFRRRLNAGSAGRNR